MRKIVVTGAFDSHVKWAIGAAEAIAGPTDEIELVLFDTDRAPDALDKTFPIEYLTRFKKYPIKKILFSDLIASNYLAQADVLVGIFLHPIFVRIIDALNRSGEALPYILTGYAGVLFQRGSGATHRIGADGVTTTSKSDKVFFEKYARNLTQRGVRIPKYFATGIPDFLDRQLDTKIRKNRIVFATQLQMPKKSGREYIATRLHEWATKAPDLTIVVKERLLPGMLTVHGEETPYRNLLIEKFETLPANLEISDRQFEQELKEAKLVVTLSSTAGVEAILAGVPTAFIDDFGWPESFGLHKFMNSGCMRSLDALIEGSIPTPDPSWAADYRREPSEWARVNEDVTAYLNSSRRYLPKYVFQSPLSSIERSPQAIEAEGMTQRESARLAIDTGDYGRAERIIRRAIFNRPNNAEAHAILIEILTATGRGHEARTLYKRSRERFPKSEHVQGVHRLVRAESWDGIISAASFATRSFRTLRRKLGATLAS